MKYTTCSHFQSVKYNDSENHLLTATFPDWNIKMLSKD